MKVNARPSGIAPLTIQLFVCIGWCSFYFWGCFILKSVNRGSDFWQQHILKPLLRIKYQTLFLKTEENDLFDSRSDDNGLELESVFIGRVFSGPAFSSVPV